MTTNKEKISIEGVDLKCDKAVKAAKKKVIEAEAAAEAAFRARCLAQIACTMYDPSYRTKMDKMKTEEAVAWAAYVQAERDYQAELVRFLLAITH